MGDIDRRSREGRLIGTAVKVPARAPTGRALLWSMRTGPEVGASGGFSCERDALGAAGDLAGGQGPAVVVVRQGNRFFTHELVARPLERGARAGWRPWAFARGRLPGDLFISTRRHIDRNGIVAVVDHDWDLVAWSFGAA